MSTEGMESPFSLSLVEQEIKLTHRSPLRMGRGAERRMGRHVAQEKSSWMRERFLIR